MSKHFKTDTTADSKTIKHTARRVLLILILLLLGLFIFTERNSLQIKQRTDLYPVTDKTPTVAVSLLGNHTVTQKFIAKETLISSVKIRFNNPGRNTATGKVKLTLLDDQGAEVATTEIGADTINANKITRFILGGDSELANSNKIVQIVGTGYKTNIISVEKGKEYTLVLEAVDVGSEDVFELVMYTEDGFGSDKGEFSATIDGAEQTGAWLNSVIYYRKLHMKILFLFAAMILFTAIFVLIPFEKIDEKIPGTSTWLSRIMLLLTPFAVYFIIQRFYGMGIGAFIKQVLSPIGALNLWIIISVILIIYTITNRARFTTIFSTIVAALFGFTNYAMVIFRDSPLIATDIAQWETGLQVVKSYEITWDKSSIWAILVTVLWCVAAFSLGGHKGLPARKRLIPLAASIICAGSCYYAIFRSSLIQDMDIHVSGFRPKASYQYNGSALSFAVTAKNAHVVKPSGYDPEIVANIAKTYTSDEAVTVTKVSKKTPNVIVIMNESFADMTSVGEFATNEDFMPYFRSLKENTIHGWMQSSVFGGSTADSEFECLTGFTMNYLPFHSVPYRSVINEEIPSLAYYFKQLGYGGITAFHPGMRDSYRRDVVYPLLGFDKHIAFDDLENPEQIRDFVSDACDYQELEKEFEQFRSSSGDQPFFMFNVTIQNHGGYAFNTGIVDHGITITDEKYNEESGLQFINLMKYSDEALKDLLDYFSNVDEETVIVLFGDHQPKLEPEFYSRLKTQHPGISALEWATLKHQVPFTIWANYDIEEQDDLKISANYIAPYLKSVIGLPMTGFDKYLMELHTQLPKISAISYQDAAGGIYDPAEPSQYDEKLNEYGIIQYNGLIDKKNRVEDFFRLK